MGDRRSQGMVRELHNWRERQVYQRREPMLGSAKPRGLGQEAWGLRSEKCPVSWGWQEKKKKNKNSKDNSRNLTTY